MAINFEYAQKAKEAAWQMATISEVQKNQALSSIKRALILNQKHIFHENQKDLLRAQAEGISLPLQKRLVFDDDKLRGVLDGIESLIQLPDPVGKRLLSTKLDEGLELYKISCPIGVIGVIFESRPDALIQISTLCLKSGNSVVLKGGSEASHTNRALAEVIMAASDLATLPKGWLTLLESRSDVEQMLALDKYIDLLIPRGSNDFVKYIMNHSSIPVLGHADGVCHLYIQEEANLKMAKELILDSKTQYVTACNTLETLLVDQKIADILLPELIPLLLEHKIKLYGSAAVAKIHPMELVKDWHHEYLDYELSINIVSDPMAAIAHINRYGSGHTDGIITDNAEIAELFMNSVDSGNVFWNCSTRFSDGFRYGFGAEVGISTAKIHARGPVGLEGLLTYKYKLIGHGQTVKPYAIGEKQFQHKPIPLEGDK